MSSLSSASTSNTPASNFFHQSSFSSTNPPEPYQCEHLNPALLLDHEDPEKEAYLLEDSLDLGLRADLDKEALIVDKKQKAKKRFQLTGTTKDNNKDCLLELKEDFSTKDPLLLPLVSRTNCSFEKWDIEEEGEQGEGSSKYPYLSSVYYDALEEPAVVGQLAVHHPLSQQGVEQQQPKTNSPASALNSTSSAVKQTCVAAAGSVAGGVPGEPTAHSTPNKPTLTSAEMVRRLTGAARKRHQAQHVSVANQRQSTSSSTTGRSSLQGAGEALHLVNSNTNPRNSRHQPVQARHNQMYLITTLLPNGQSDLQALINRVLPKELILRVFSYLDIVSLCRCAQVCRSWNKLAMDGSNWQSVDLFDFQKDVKTAVVESLARRCGGFLKTLSLRGCESVQDSAMRSFAAKCPNIERLSLNKCKLITDATCEFIGRYCHRLKELDLENCTAITDLTMKFISEGCKRLEELNISWCENITDRGIAYICRGSPNLHTLICKGCEGLSPSCFAQVNNDLKQLRKLSLLSCSNVTDETVEQLANGCNQLEFLCLSNCKEITDQALNAIAQGCPNIKDLELASCTNLTDTGFITLSKNCHELERMDLEDCSLITDAALLNLNNGCPNLSSLALSHCENLTDTGLAELCATHKECLAVLELDNCPNITDAALDSMKTLKHLERVDLFDCQMITKDAIKKFKQFRPEVDVHAYFAPATPPVVPQPQRNGICRCCAIL